MKEKQTLWLVVHTHWEGAVFKTRDEYLEDGFRIILNGLNLLEQHPSYRFVLDQVYDDSLTSFRFSKRLVDEIIDRKFESILAKIDTQGAGIPVVVFNGQGWSRTDVAEIAVAFSEPGIVDVNLQGPDGEEVAVQITAPQRFDDGGLRQAKLVFVAEDIPALGYAVYHVLPQQSLRASGQVAGRAGTEHWSKAWSSGTSHRDSSSVENEFYRATFNCWTGEMTSLYVKDGGWEALSGPANVIAREHDGGDFWELYGNLDGARNIAMSRTHAVPTRETGAQLSNQFVGAGNVVEGPVFAEFNSAQPFGSGSLSTRVRVYNGIRRVEIRTTINNEDRFVRYRAVFPTACEKGTNTHEIPFGAIERAEGIEFPAQRWVDCGDEQRGVALLNRGLPGNNAVDGTLLLSLMRSARINSYAYQGGYEPGAGSDSGLMEGRQLSFDYALMPHGESWREAQVYRAGYEFNEPLLVRKAEAHAGVLRKRWGLLELSQANVVVSALKVGAEGATVFRVYEAAGKGAAGLQIKLNAEVESAAIINLVEDVDGSLEVEDNSIQIDLAPFEIKTLALRLRVETA